MTVTFNVIYNKLLYITNDIVGNRAVNKGHNW